MKKLLKLFSLTLAFIAIFSSFTSAKDCIERDLGNNSICVSIDKKSNNRYKLNSDIDCNDDSCAVNCSILLPDNTMPYLGKCDGDFYYNASSSKKVKLYITINNKSDTIEEYYDFGDGSRGGNGGGGSHYYDDIEVSASPSNPDTYEWVKLDIETDSDYVGRVTFSKFQYKSSSSSTWSTISSRTNSTYVSDYSSTWSDGYYRMTSSNHGSVSLRNLVKFKKTGYYRIYVRDEDGNEDYVQINVNASSSYNDDIEVSVSPSNPDTYEWIKLDIETDSDYVGRVTFSKFQYKSSSSSTWSTISSRTNSTYVSDYSSVWSDGYYRMTSSDRGSVSLRNLVKFKKTGYYRIYVRDEDGNEDYVQINVNASSSYNDDIEVSVSPSNPDTYEWIKLDIETDSDYVGRVTFSKFQYKSSSSSTWSTISSRTNSTYVSDYSSVWSDGYYRMTSSDRGSVSLRNLVKFKKSGYYRIYVRDEDGNEDYVQINVNASSSYNDDIEVSVSPSNPDTYEWIKLDIETDSDYVGRVTFSKFQYKSSSSSTWSTISSRTNSTYVSDYSSVWSDGYYRMTSSDRGSVSLRNLVKFKKSGYYRIYVRDEDGNEDYVQINVNASSSYNDDIEVSVSPSNPDTYEWIKLDIETDSDYVGRVTFSKFQYKSSSSSTWSTISSRTNSTYVSDYSSVWSDGYYRMTSSDRGSVSLRNLVKFKKSGYYRIYVRDEDGNEDYVQINVNASSYNNNLELETDDDSPSASEYVDLTVKTDSSYRGKINFSAKYRSSISNSRASISRTNSTYFLNQSTTWRNGFVTMTSSDRGEKTIRNIFKFAKKGYYRIIAEDEDGNSTYLDFNVGYADSDPLDGFTRKEFEMIERIYNVWPTLISKLKSEYPRLRNSTTWKNLSDELYKNMGDVVNKKSNREFQDYEDFDYAFRYRFSYTQNLMD